MRALIGAPAKVRVWRELSDERASSSVEKVTNQELLISSLIDSIVTPSKRERTISSVVSAGRSRKMTVFRATGIETRTPVKVGDKESVGIVRITSINSLRDIPVLEIEESDIR